MLQFALCEALPAPDMTEPVFGWCGAHSGVNIIDTICSGWRRAVTGCFE